MKKKAGKIRQTLESSFICSSGSFSFDILGRVFKYILQVMPSPAVTRTFLVNQTVALFLASCSSLSRTLNSDDCSFSVFWELLLHL